MGTVTRLGGAAADISSNFNAVVDSDACLACDLCAESCPVGAIAVDDIAEVDVVECIGCGVCVTRCPEGALALVRRATTHQPPKDYEAWLEQVAAEKGRTEVFQGELGEA
jgi:heterodisulfide reductase subunit A-like polyferredoxin